MGTPRCLTVPWPPSGVFRHYGLATPSGQLISGASTCFFPVALLNPRLAMTREDTMKSYAYLLTALGLVSLTAAARADLHFAQPRVDLGEVRTCRKLTHRFAFVNRGAEAVQVVGAQTTCGCLVPRLERRTYQPGEVGEVVLDI